MKIYTKFQLSVAKVMPARPKKCSTWEGVNTLSVFVCIISDFSSGEDKDEENEETESTEEDEDGKWMELAQQLLESLK